tara:strand:+ start:116 stop:433 length:318 start_codon:yes stop_codon:yes gene_type:complete
MKKSQLEEMIDEQSDHIAELMDRILEQDKVIAYLEGMVNGLGIRKKMKKAGDPRIDTDNMIEGHEDFCDCMDCSKERNLEESSKEILKWSKKKGVQIDKGSADDN